MICFSLHGSYLARCIPAILFSRTPSKTLHINSNSPTPRLVSSPMVLPHHSPAILTFIPCHIRYPLYLWLRKDTESAGTKQKSSRNSRWPKNSITYSVLSDGFTASRSTTRLKGLNWTCLTQLLHARTLSYRSHVSTVHHFFSCSHILALWYQHPYGHIQDHEISLMYSTELDCLKNYSSSPYLVCGLWWWLGHNSPSRRTHGNKHMTFSWEFFYYVKQRPYFLPLHR